MYLHYRHTDVKVVLDCLKQALRRADKVMEKDDQIPLWIALLNRYLYYFAEEVPEISAANVNKLLQMISSELKENAAERGSSWFDEAERYFQNTLAYIHQKASTDERYAEMNENE